MHHVDLGLLDGPVLVFGGPYSNVQATKALFEIAKAKAIPASNLICTGDVVAYGANPIETVATVRAAGCTVVAGNCEKQISAGALDCGCGFDEGSTCDLLSAGWYAFANATVPEADRRWMGQCPDSVTFTHAGQRCAVIHGGVTDISRFLWSVDADDAFASEIAAVEADVGRVDTIFAGHSGIAFERQIAGHRWVNAGVIGMPPNYGRRQTEFVTVEGGQVQFHTLDYDAQAAADAMVAAGLTQGYNRALLSGIWPSQDVLPQALAQSSSSLPSLAIG